MAAYTHCRTRLTVSTGDAAEDEILRGAGFCPITPDLTVTSFTDADEAMRAIDCWMSDQMIPRVAELIAAAADWTSANLGY